MLAYVPKHSVHLRMPLTVWDWLIAKADGERMPPSSYAVKRLKELARQDLVQGSPEVQSGDLRAQAG